MTDPHTVIPDDPTANLPDTVAALVSVLHATHKISTTSDSLSERKAASMRFEAAALALADALPAHMLTVSEQRYWAGFDDGYRASLQDENPAD